MNTTNLLVLAGVLPAIVLCIYIYKKDTVEKEPVRLLLKLLALGALSCFPGAYIESFIGDIIRGAFYPAITDVDGSLGMDGSVRYLYSFVYYFFCVAITEEGLKWIIMRCITADDKNHNCFFDGMIYAIFVSLGFAGLENVFYVLEYGWGNALMRAVLSVPGHMFFAVFMGYYYSHEILLRKAKNREAELIELGVISSGKKPFYSGGNMALSILMPVLLHGTYNFLCSSESIVLTLVFYVFIAFLYRHCFKKIGKMSRNDNYHRAYAEMLIYNKYPGEMDEFYSQIESSSSFETVQ